MNSLHSELTAAVDAWDARAWPRPNVWVVSGSGLAVDLLPDSSRGRIPLQEILPFPLAAIEGHPLSVELLEGEGHQTVAYQRGRVHTYQGYDAAQTVFHVRLAALLGAGTLIMTNAAGSLRPEVGPGQLVAVNDHINMMGMNPLTGTLPDAWGPLFPDMTETHDRDLRSRAMEIAEGFGFTVGEGVYVGVPGPSYETPAEIRMLRTMGADLVGMSTVLEVIAAGHMGMRCLCISMVSNHAAGIGEGVLEHDDVLEIGRTGSEQIRQLLERLLAEPA